MNTPTNYPTDEPGRNDGWSVNSCSPVGIKPTPHGPQCACRDCLVAHCAMERALANELADILRDFVSGLADMTTEEFRTGNDYILRRAGEAALAKFDAARART